MQEPLAARCQESVHNAAGGINGRTVEAVVSSMAEGWLSADH